MAGGAYYNEFDPYAAAWLRNLIKAGHIAPGDVDERSILDVCPDDLRGYTQCHFFAGLGGWSLALRRAGWEDEREIWSGSCSCQPFSSAGKGDGFADERHVWPDFQWLISQRRPRRVVGEQVASKNADPWLDLVQADLEGLGYAFGAVAFPSAGVGAPHIRDRTYWVADSSSGCFGRGPGQASDGRDAPRLEPERLRHAGGLDDDDDEGLERLGCGHQAARGRHGTIRSVAASGEFNGLGNPVGERRRETGSAGRGSAQRAANAGATFDVDSGTWAGPTNGVWRDADWLFCRDGKWRPVEPGTFPLAHGAASRVGRLRAYGNAINIEAATEFVRALGA